MLTRAIIEAAKPPASGRTVIWDGEGGLPGFGVRIFASGQRSFVVRYRLGSRRLWTLTIGTYGLITLAQARKRAQEALAAAERERRGLLTVRELTARYTIALKTGAVQSRRSRGSLAAEYLTDVQRHLDRFSTAYGRRPAAEVTRADVLALLSGFLHQPGAHRRLCAAVRRLYAWARVNGLVAAGVDPTADVTTVSTASRDRVLSLAELARIWRAAGELAPVYRDLVHLLIATGQRRGEVAGMTWGEIDLLRGLWTLPGGRTKARRQHVVPLPPAAVRLLEARRAACQRVHAEDLVLPVLGEHGKGLTGISGFNWLKRELDLRSGVVEWRLHDFRRSLVSICAEHGVDIGTLDTMLNHASSSTRPGVLGVYQRATLVEPMRKVMALWGELLDAAIATGTVVPIRPLPIAASG
jgi:integrase